ncbi:type II toxin-antitoxin system RelE family toxin [Streptomyces sp. TP-A0874]|uniref:type II toxin-antitoxin system RelE family toxin n=1 Tax=Streptomyces sp. TP-A0874 TaxID=549819 RepID=UPI0009A05662|nr:type II toxin-antitoxin system RelE/ParE family toxin [Streptomyces sp. TP-A0874]
MGRPHHRAPGGGEVTGPSGLYGLRVGSYRVAYQIDNGQLLVLVVKVGDQRDVYRDL